MKKDTDLPFPFDNRTLVLVVLVILAICAIVFLKAISC